MPRFSAVICDFDGVINQSTQKGLARIIKIARQAGHSIPNGIRQRLKEKWGTHGTKLIEICFDLDQATSQALYKKWEEVDTTLFLPLVKGVKNALAELKRNRKLRVGMLTSRNRKNLFAVLDYYGLVAFFDCIQTKDDWPFIKPDPRSFDYILNKLGVTPDQCVYIGDTPVDYESANKKGIPNLSVLSGIFNEEDFLAIGQKKENIIPSISCLPGWLSDNNSSGLNNAEIIEKIIQWQKGLFHPLTCGNDSSHPDLEAREENGKVILFCTACGYKQEHVPNVVLR